MCFLCGYGKTTVCRIFSCQRTLAELEGYGSRLKAFTGGHGSYTMALARYEQAPPTVQQALAAEYAKHRKHDED